MAEKPRLSLTTPEFHAFGVNLAEARRPQGYPNAKAKYSLSMPFSPAAFEPIRVQLEAFAKQAFPSMDERGRIVRPNGDTVTLKLPFESGNNINASQTAKGKKPFDYLAGQIVLKASADEGRQPGICDIQGAPVAPGKIKGGDILRAAVGFLGVDIPGSFVGIACYLNAVLLVRAGETRNPADTFKAFLSATPDVNPFAAATDPFGGL